jgi:GNAT superfamily N-acetyltransferase
MPILQDFLRHEMPAHLAVQVRSFIRTQWPFLTGKNTQLWNYTPQVNPSRHFVLVDGELLISHAAANVRAISHRGRTWQVAGLSTVFTYPDRRGAGFAAQVVAAATRYIQQSDADLAMLFAGDHLEKFYENHGWQAASAARILFGPTASPTLKTDNLVMSLFISPAAREHLDWFTTQDFYVGESTW